MNASRKKIVLAGGSGFLGQSLRQYFEDKAWQVVILTRNPRRPGDVLWDAAVPGPWQKELEGAAAIANLTGRSVDCRYTARNRNEILESRVNSTEILGKVIGQCRRPPPVWLNAGTATIYKHTFGEPWDEDGECEAVAEAKDAFSVQVAMAWERALDQANTPRTRKVALRMAMVLGHGNNSVFPVLRRLVRLGLGGAMAGGAQYVSWIHHTDFCRAADWLIEHEDFAGPVNIVSPNPLPNGEMMETLRNMYRVPIGLPAPAWLLEIGAFFLRTETELIIKSRRVIPGRLLKSGFEFRFPTIQPAFENLGRSR